MPLDSTRRAVALAALLAPRIARAQSSPPNPTRIPGAAPSREQAAAEGRSGLYVPLWARLKRDAATGDEIATQLLVQYCASVGDEPGALARERALPSKPAFPIDTVRVEPALDAIVRLSKGRRVVILNEAHHVSRCRAFGHAVALRLRREGFSVFAAESFTNADQGRAVSALNAGGPVTFDSGYYTHDPVFAEMLRGARQVGYGFAAYEQRPDQDPGQLTGRAGIPAREAAQATNLAALLERRPEARVLVYCGFNHAAKVPQRASGERWMATRLRERTGVDPLTINQAFGYPGPDRDHEREGVTRVLDRFAPLEPVSLTQADGRPWVIGYSNDSFDIQIVHPRLATSGGRPGWLAAAPDRREVRIPLPPGLPSGALVQAVDRAEAAKALNTVPSDQYPLSAADVREAHFHLRPGDYVVRVESDSGRHNISTTRA